MELMHITGHIITLFLRIDQFYSIIELQDGVCVCVCVRVCVCERERERDRQRERGGGRMSANQDSNTMLAKIQFTSPYSLTHIHMHVLTHTACI